MRWKTAHIGEINIDVRLPGDDPWVGTLGGIDYGRMRSYKSARGSARVLGKRLFGEYIGNGRKNRGTLIGTRIRDKSVARW